MIFVDSKVFFVDSTQPQTDLQEVFYSALSLLSVSDFFVHAKFKKYAGLSSKARVRGQEFTAFVSDGFACADRSVLLGLALHLSSRVFRKRLNSELAEFVGAYKEFVSRESAGKLHDSLRRERGRNFFRAESNAHDLNAAFARVWAQYAELFAGVGKPSLSWSASASRRRMGFFDSAFNKITVSRVLDNSRVPLFVVDYIVFHELLHAKHDCLYQRGKSLRRVVHSRTFKDDEKKFACYAQAVSWLDNARFRGF